MNRKIEKQIEDNNLIIQTQKMEIEIDQILNAQVHTCYSYVNMTCFLTKIMRGIKTSVLDKNRVLLFKGESKKFIIRQLWRRRIADTYY